MTTEQHLEKFHETVSILVKAYLDNSLMHGKCTACAVGNIIRHHTGKKPKHNPDLVGGVHHNIWSDNSPVLWGDAFRTITNKETGPYQYVNVNENMVEFVMNEIGPTGYSIEEMMKIEFAFESAPTENVKDLCNAEWMFNGLMAVVDVLAEIHGVDLSVTESAKLQFVK